MNTIINRKINDSNLRILNVQIKADEEDQAEFLQQNSIQYYDDPQQQNQKNQDVSYSQNFQLDNSRINNDSKEMNNNSFDYNQSNQKQNNNDDLNQSTHIQNSEDKQISHKQNSVPRVILSGKKSNRESQNGQNNLMNIKQRLSMQKSLKGQNEEELLEKSLYQINDANEITKQQFSQLNTSQNIEYNHNQNLELKKLREQNERLREELKVLSDRLSVVIEKNQKNILNSKNRINNQQTSDQVLRSELNNAYKLIDAIQKENKKLQNQAYEGNSFEKVMKLENDIKIKDQEVKNLKKEIELNKKFQKISLIQDEDKKELAMRRKDDFTEKYTLKQKIKDLQEKLSEQSDYFNKQYREFLNMEKEYRRMCEKVNIQPNYVFNEQENAFEKQPKQNGSRERRLRQGVSNAPKRSSSLKPFERSRVISVPQAPEQNNINLNQYGNDPEFQNVEFNEANFYDLLQKLKVYKKSKISCEKKLNNEINDLRAILTTKNQEIIQLKQQLLNRDRQSHNLQSQLNQIKRQKQNLNEQQSYSQVNQIDNNILVDDNNEVPEGDLTSNSIQFATPVKQERDMPKKKVLLKSNSKVKSKSPNPKSIITQSDLYSGKKLISNPIISLPSTKSAQKVTNIKSPRKSKIYNVDPYEYKNKSNSPQKLGYDPISNNRSPKKQDHSHVQPYQVSPLNNQQTPERKQKQQNNKINKSHINQSMEELDSYSPTRFQTEEKNYHNPNNLLLQQSILNKEQFFNSQRGFSSQKQMLIPLTLRDVQIGVESDDNYRFTDRITLKQNYHHKIIYIQVAHDNKGLLGIKCNYRLQKSSQIVEGDMHIIQNYSKNQVQNQDSSIFDDFDIEKTCEGDYLKYVQGTINIDTNQIINLIFVTAKGYRKVLGLKNQNNQNNLQIYNFDISENEIPICLYGSLQKIYGKNENVIGSVLTLIGFNVERDEIEENIKTYYVEDDKVRTEFEAKQRNQEVKKRMFNSSTQFIREDQIESEQISKKSSKPTINYINDEKDNRKYSESQEINKQLKKQNMSNPSQTLSQAESPHFKQTSESQSREQQSNPIYIINQQDSQQKNHDLKSQKHKSSSIQKLSNDFNIEEDVTQPPTRLPEVSYEDINSKLTSQNQSQYHFQNKNGQKNEHIDDNQQSVESFQNKASEQKGSKRNIELENNQTNKQEINLNDKIQQKTQQQQENN